MSYSNYDQYYTSPSSQPNYTTRTIYPSPSTDQYQMIPRSYDRSQSYSTSPISPTSTIYYNPNSPSSSSQSSQDYNPPSPAYYCLYQGCNHASARKADLERHVQVTHLRESLELVDCQQVGCHRKGRYGFTRKDKMIDHMRDVHKADIPKRKTSGQGGQQGISVMRR